MTTECSAALPTLRSENIEEQGLEVTQEVPEHCFLATTQLSHCDSAHGLYKVGAIHIPLCVEGVAQEVTPCPEHLSIGS